MLTRLTQFSVGLLLAASLAVVAGCGGSGGGGSGGGNDTTPIGGNNVDGPADPVQTALIDVGEGAGDAPAVGDTSQALIEALVALLDAPDGLANGFQAFLTSQDPNDLFNGGEQAGDALLSFSAGLSETLIQLTEEGQEIPGSDVLLDQLLELEQQVQDGFTGESDGGDLSDVTNLLIEIAGQLDTVSGQVPSEVEDAPLVGDLLSALGTGANDLATILDATGRLDGDETSAALVGAFENVANELSGSLPGDASSTLDDALAQATTQFENGLAVVLNPLFQALRGVLAPVTGEQAPLSPVLSSILAADTDSLGTLLPVDGFQELLAGGGTGTDGTDIPLLSDLLAGVPVLGDLLANVLGGDAPGGTETLTNLLENGGSGNLPLLGDLLQGIPNLSDPNGTDPASLPLLGDLLTSLLSLNDQGVPVIEDVLAAAQDGGSFDADALGSILDGLLDELIPAFGGLDANGGFLDGTEGLLSIGDVVDGLLDSVLGLLGL